MLIGYARVSTIDQNPALQMDALKTAGCDKVFTEKASGSHRDRPQLKAALNYLREGDTLVVWKLSRLARSLTQVIKTAPDINDRGIALKVLTQNIDTSTSEGRLFFHMTAAFDEFQRELIVENTRAGLAAANKRGRRGGRPRAMHETCRSAGIVTHTGLYVGCGVEWLGRRTKRGWMFRSAKTLGFRARLPSFNDFSRMTRPVPPTKRRRGPVIGFELPRSPDGRSASIATLL